MDKKLKKEWTINVLARDQLMNPVIDRARKAAEKVIDLNVNARYETEDATHDYIATKKEVNHQISEGRLRLYAIHNPDKQFTKTQEFDIMANYQNKDGEVCMKCLAGK